MKKKNNPWTITKLLREENKVHLDSAVVGDQMSNVQIDQSRYQIRYGK